MSRNKKSPSLLAVALHAFLVMITGGLWLIPLTIRLMFPESSLFVVILHTIFAFATAFFWYIVLVIYWLLSNKK